MAFARIQRTQRDDPPISEINATPLVDVFLVLLVIFMLCAPMGAAHLPLDLPQAPGTASTPDTQQLVWVELDAQGQLHWQGRAVGQAELLATLQTVQQDKPQTRLQLRADQSTPYGRVVELMAALQSQGWPQLDLVLRPPHRP